MKVDALIRLIPSERLEQLAASTQVDHYSKKLQGEIVFRLLLYCLITRKENSLRTLRSAYESITFKALQNKKGVSHSSISERLSTIEVSYFEGLFKDCVSAYKNLDGINQDNLLKFDSTIVSLSANLINIGYRLAGGSAAVKQLKFTVGYSDIPEVVHFYHEQQFTSENRALKDTILDHATADNLSTIRVFDRGITARNTYDKMTSQDIFFVSRLNNSAKKEKISSNEKITSSAPVKASSVTIISDEWCYLFSSEKRSKYPIRRIEAYRNDTGEKLVFISNIKEPVELIAAWELKFSTTLHQMTCTDFTPYHNGEIDTQPLNSSHVPAMLALTALTKPGPFLEHTIDFGNYHGIFDGERLVAMAGERLHLNGFTEISAVCTHPDYEGKGYGAVLVSLIAQQIIDKGAIPFLHVKWDNQRAIKMYERLGFAHRTDMYFGVFQRR